MKRVVTYLCGASATVVLMMLATMVDGLTAHFAAPWQPDDAATQGYFLLLTPDSIVTTAGTGLPLCAITPDTLSARTGICLTQTPELKTRMPLLDAAWNYSWAKLAQSAPSSFDIFMTAAAAPGFYPPEDVLRLAPGYVSASPDSGWPLADTSVPVWVIAACEYARIMGSRELSAHITAMSREALAAEASRLKRQGTELWRGAGDGNLSGAIPEWFDRADRFNTIGTAINALAATAYYSLAALETAAGEPSDSAAARSSAIAVGMAARMWLPVKGYFSQYLYGRLAPVKSPVLSGAANAVAAASPAVTDMAMARRIVERLPCLPYGIPVTFPLPADTRGYPIEASPAVQGVWAIACSRAGDERALWNALGAILRNVGLAAIDTTLTEPPAGVCGALAGAVSRALFGMHVTDGGMAFSPLVPAVLNGEKQLCGIRWREAVLDITLSGTGSHIAGFTLDGRPCPDCIVPDTLTGHHRVRIEMVTPVASSENTLTARRASPRRAMYPEIMPAVPEIEWTTDSRGIFTGSSVPGAAVMRNGVRLDDASGPEIILRPANGYAETLVVPLDGNGMPAGHSAPPHVATPPGSALNFQAEWFSARALAREYYRAYLRRWRRLKQRGRATDADRPNRRLTQLVELTSDESIDFTIEATDTCLCAIEIGYADGRDAGSRADILRTLSVNGTPMASVLMPRNGEPADTTVTLLTHPMSIALSRGMNTITLASRPADLRPGQTRDTVMIDFIRITTLPYRP